MIKEQQGRNHWQGATYKLSVSTSSAASDRFYGCDFIFSCGRLALDASPRQQSAIAAPQNNRHQLSLAGRGGGTFVSWYSEIRCAISPGFGKALLSNLLHMSTALPSVNVTVTSNAPVRGRFGLPSTFASGYACSISRRAAR